MAVSSAAAASGEPFSQVELSISCSRLKDLDHFSKSDPAVFLYEKKGHEWIKLGRTEVIDNNLNPKVSWQTRQATSILLTMNVPRTVWVHVCH